MAKNKVEITGISTNNLERISDSEMTDLFKKLLNAKDNERENIRHRLALGNLKLVLSTLKEYNNRNENLDDLFQIGVIGLMKAIDNFDLSYGVKFSTYSVLLIRGEISKYLRDSGTIRVSRSVKDNAYKILKYRNEYIIENGKEPSIDEIKNILNLSNEDIIYSLEATKSVISYQEPIYNDGGETIYLEDQISNKDNDTKFIENIALKDSINNLKNKEKKIIYDRYIIGKTQIELSEELNISQAQVSRIEKNALLNIKKSIK